jgi:hypothetical protein
VSLEPGAGPSRCDGRIGFPGARHRFESPKKRDRFKPPKCLTCPSDAEIANCKAYGGNELRHRRENASLNGVCHCMSCYVIVCHGSLSFNFVSLPSRREGEGRLAETHCSAGLVLQLVTRITQISRLACRIWVRRADVSF